MPDETREGQREAPEARKPAKAPGAEKAREADSRARQEAAAGLLEGEEEKGHEAAPDKSFVAESSDPDMYFKVEWDDSTLLHGYTIDFPKIGEMIDNHEGYDSRDDKKAALGLGEEDYRAFVFSENPDARKAKVFFDKAVQLAKDAPSIVDLFKQMKTYSESEEFESAEALLSEAELTEDEKEMIGNQKEFFSKGISEALSNVWVGSEDYEDIFTEAENMDEVAKEAAKIIEKAYVQGWSEEKFLEKLSEIPVRFPDEYRDQVGEEHSSLGGFLRHTGSRSLGRSAEHVYNQLISERQ